MTFRTDILIISIATATIGIASTARSEPNAKYSQAIVHFENARYDEAWQLTKEAMDENPDLKVFPKIHRLQGRILAARQQWVDSIVSFFRSLEFDPKPDTSRYPLETQKSIECAKKHRARLSESDLRAALERAPLNLPWACPDVPVEAKPEPDGSESRPIEIGRCTIADAWKLSANKKYEAARKCLAEVTTEQPASSPVSAEETASLEATIACGERNRTASVLSYFDAVQPGAVAVRARNIEPICAELATCAAHHARAQTSKESFTPTTRDRRASRTVGLAPRPQTAPNGLSGPPALSA